MAFLYTALVTAFGWEFGAVGESRALRTVGGLLIVYGLLGLIWPFAPMHLRPALAAGDGSLTDTIHITLGIVTVLLMLVAIGFGGGPDAGSGLFHRDAHRVVRLWRSHGTEAPAISSTSPRCRSAPGANQHRRVRRGHGAVLHASSGGRHPLLLGLMAGYCAYRFNRFSTFDPPTTILIASRCRGLYLRARLRSLSLSAE
jgi:hypothetical protein